MKKLLTLIAIVFISINLFAQAPQKMSYQAVIRNASNVLVTNAPVKMRISILQGSATGNEVYSELHSATTNGNGLASIEIGNGTSQQGTFSSINWGNGTYFLKTETDPNGGTNYSIEGTSQLLSVPYALYAGNVASTNKIIFTKQTTGGGIIEIWTMNYDGSNPTKIPIILPPGIQISTTTGPKMSPDGKKIFFTADDGQNISRDDIYSCNSDGSNVKKIFINPDVTAGLILGDAY